MQWNKRGDGFQGTICSVYGAINLNRAALLSTDAGSALPEKEVIPLRRKQA